MDHFAYLQELNAYLEDGHARAQSEYERKWRSLVASEFRFERDALLGCDLARATGASQFKRVVVALESQRHLTVVQDDGDGARTPASAAALEEPDYGFGAEGGALEYNLLRIVPARDGAEWILVMAALSGGARTAFGYRLMNAEFVEIPSAWTSFAARYGREGAVTYSLGCILGYIYRWHTLSNLGAVDSTLFSLIAGGYPRDVRRGLWRTGTSATVRHLALNDAQRRAVEGLQFPIEIIHGPPGTGKSTTICEALAQRTDPSGRVLVCTTTNKAIDSLTDKLSRVGFGDQILAVGSQSRLEPSTWPFLMHNRMATAESVRRATRVRSAFEVALAASDAVEVAEGTALVSPDTPAAERVRVLLAALQDLAAAAVDAGGGVDSRGTLPTTQAVVTASDSAWDDDGVANESTRAPVSGADGESGNLEDKTAQFVHEALSLTNDSLRSLSSAMTGASWFVAPSLQVQIRVSLWSLGSLLERWESLVQSVVAADLWRSSRFIVCTCSTAVRLSDRLQRDLASLGAFSDASQQRITVDTVVLDECGAMLEVDALGTLLHGARTLLLVGDHLQLPPLSKWRNDVYTTSLLERLVVAADGGADSHSGERPVVHFLDTQCRMPPDQCRIVSEIFYGGRLHTAPEKEAGYLSARDEYARTATFHDVSGREQTTADATFMNATEVAAVVDHVADLLARGVGATSVCVLTFYRGQVRAIFAALRARGSPAADVLVATVDAMQGREADHVIVSCVRTESVGFLRDQRRINVALSRARKELHVFGASACLSQSPHWRRALGFLSSSTRFFKTDARQQRQPPQRKPETSQFHNVATAPPLAASVEPSVRDSPPNARHPSRPQHPDSRGRAGPNASGLETRRDDFPALSRTKPSAARDDFPALTASTPRAVAVQPSQSVAAASTRPAASVVVATAPKSNAPTGSAGPQTTPAPADGGRKMVTLSKNKNARKA